MKCLLRRIFLACVCLAALCPVLAAADPFVAVIDMDMMILPGTASYLDKGISIAEKEGAKLIVVKLNTPGGMLDTTQRMIQSIFKSKVPVVIYITPSGSSATSAGVFITAAGHVAAMAPGTSIGAAHPVSGEGKNIEGDMRAKVENMTVAMVRSITEQRGRNVEWVEKSIKESSSITEKEALKLNVVDLLSDNLDDLLKRIKGKQVNVDDQKVTLEDYSALPRHEIEFGLKDKAINVVANPNVMALLWLAATTGLSIELYNPGAILPGVVGLICLIIALAATQIIPINQGALLLFILGALLIGAELWIPSGILGVGGIIAMVLGAIYLFDGTGEPGMAVSLSVIMPVALLLGGLMLITVMAAARNLKRRKVTGVEGLIGQRGKVVDPVSSSGMVFVNGELWKATVKEGVLEKDAPVEVLQVLEGLVLEVKRI